MLGCGAVHTSHTVSSHLGHLWAPCVWVWLLAIGDRDSITHSLPGWADSPRGLCWNRLCLSRAEGRTSPRIHAPGKAPRRPACTHIWCCRPPLTSTLSFWNLVDMPFRSSHIASHRDCSSLMPIQGRSQPQPTALGATSPPLCQPHSGCHTGVCPWLKQTLARFAGFAPSCTRPALGLLGRRGVSLQPCWIHRDTLGVCQDTWSWIQA